MPTPLELPQYWIPHPVFTPTEDEVCVFRGVRDSFNNSSQAVEDIILPPSITKWHFLDWIVRSGGVLLHGSVQADITMFRPRTPNDHSADDFSKQTAVYATTDSIWSIYYAVLDRSHGARHLNACLQFQTGETWSELHYFFSLDRKSHARNPWRPGFVYLLPAVGFVQQPPYGVQAWTVLDPHFANQKEVRPFAKISVDPSDFPLLNSVRQHVDHEVIEAQKENLFGFPWLG